MKLYKHYFDKSDTPFNQLYQKKRKWHTVWFRGKYRIFLQCKVIKVKFLGLFTIYELTNENRAEIEQKVKEMKEKWEKIKYE